MDCVKPCKTFPSRRRLLRIECSSRVRDWPLFPASRVRASSGRWQRNWRTVSETGYVIPHGHCGAHGVLHSILAFSLNCLPVSACVVAPCPLLPSGSDRK
jgi:hypothetical protein